MARRVRGKDEWAAIHSKGGKRRVSPRLPWDGLFGKKESVKPNWGVLNPNDVRLLKVRGKSGRTVHEINRPPRASPRASTEVESRFENLKSVLPDQFYLSKPLSNGDFRYYLVAELTDMESATGDVSEGKYMLTLSAVSPSQARKQLPDALRNYNVTDNTPKDEVKVEALATYGVKAHLKEYWGNDAEKLLKEADTDIPLVSGLFGFFMDKRQNALGATGWDFIKGDIDGKAYREGLREYRKQKK
jgi:hypothetical protein